MTMGKEINNIDRYISKQLHEMRVKKRLTLACVAAHIGKSYQQVQKYERAQTKISASVLYELASFYEIRMDKFFSGIEDEKNAYLSNNILNILLVEDNPGDEAITRKALSSFKHANILCVHDGIQTLEFLRYKTLCNDFSKPNIIFLDWGLPKKDGLTVLKELKRDLETKDIPVIVVTNNFDINNEIKKSALKNGASGYIQKSFDFHAFKRDIEDCIKFLPKMAMPT